MEGLSPNGSAGSLSANNGASALAQSVLPPTLQSLGLNNVPTVALGTVTLGQSLTTLSQQIFSTMTVSPTKVTPAVGTPVILTDVTHNVNSDRDDTSGNGTGSDISAVSSNTEEKLRKVSVSPQKRGEVYV